MRSRGRSRSRRLDQKYHWFVVSLLGRTAPCFHRPGVCRMPTHPCAQGIRAKKSIARDKRGPPMYVPVAFAEPDLTRLHDFIEQNSFGLLVSQVDGLPFASHLPFL